MTEDAPVKPRVNPRDSGGLAHVPGLSASNARVAGHSTQAAYRFVGPEDKGSKKTGDRAKLKT